MNKSLCNSATKINPVKSVIHYCSNKTGGCGIQELNDKCYNIASAFNGDCSAWDVPDNLANQCDNLVNVAKMDIYGVGSCDKQSPYRPFLIRNKHLFPPLLEKGYSKEEALKMCVEISDTLELKENCYLDYNALVEDGKLLTSGNDNNKNSQKILLIVGIVVLVLLFIGAGYKIVLKRK